MFEIAHDIGVDGIWINGDFLDFYNVNSHGPKHPCVGTTLEDELSWGRMALKEIRKMFPDIPIKYIYGNHEDRLERFIVQNCKQLFDSVKLHRLLGLKSLNIEWFPYNTRHRIEDTNLYLQHSPPSYGKNGAMTSLEKDVDQSSIYGCTHRQQAAARTGKSGEQYYCYFNGWMGSTTRSREHARVFSYAKGHESWQKCFAIVTTFGGVDFKVQQIEINNGKAFYGDSVYE
jgi:hypothetical protein